MRPYATHIKEIDIIEEIENVDLQVITSRSRPIGKRGPQMKLEIDVPPVRGIRSRRTNGPRRADEQLRNQNEKSSITTEHALKLV